MNRYKCPACGRNQYTSKDEAEGCIYCVYKGPLENMGPAETEKAKQEIEEAFEEACIDDVEKAISYLRVAIGALERQVPKETIGEEGYPDCTVCGAGAIGPYCYKCGQRLVKAKPLKKIPGMVRRRFIVPTAGRQCCRND